MSESVLSFVSQRHARGNEWVCFAVWFDPKVTVNRLAEVSMLLHLIFWFIYLFFWWGQWKSWQDKYKSELQVTCWALLSRATKTLMLELFPTHLHNNRILFPKGNNMPTEAVSGTEGHMLSHSDWALEHASSDLSFAHLFWAVSLLHPLSGNRWH